VYQERSLQGRLAFSKEKLQKLFGQCFETVELRRMQEINGEQTVFGKAFMWAALFKKDKERKYV
jgi:hypothetical protein